MQTSNSDKFEVAGVFVMHLIELPHSLHIEHYIRSSCFTSGMCLCGMGLCGMGLCGMGLCLDYTPHFIA